MRSLETAETDRELTKEENPNQIPHLDQIYPGQAGYTASFELINRYSGSSNYRQLGFRVGQWFETSAEIYWYFLGCLPPVHQTSGGFVMSECTMDGLHDCFLEIDGRYYCAVVKWSGPRSFAQIWTQLLMELATRGSRRSDSTA